jgi:ABC-type molybdate transport system substrate-binding protein
MALEAAGASLDDVVRLDIYVKNLRQEDGAVIRKALRRVFVRDTLPTSTWLGVTSLALDELVATQILTTPGVELVGPLPQELRITSSFVGAISSQAQAPEAARDLMAFLKTPAAVKVMRAQGMEPLFYGAQRTVLGTWSVVRPG